MRPLAFVPDEDTTSLHWIRRDIRIHDNAGLFHALKENVNVLPLFIFDTVLLDKLEDKTDRRVAFIHESLLLLKRELELLGTSLLILQGDPCEIFQAIKARSVYTNTDYEPYARERDERVRKLLANRNIPFKTFKDQVIFEKAEVMKDDGRPYTVFSPYRKKWTGKLNRFYTRAYPVEKYAASFLKCNPLPMPSLEDLGFMGTAFTYPERRISQSVIKAYDKNRNFPSFQSTTRLGIHLRFGTVSIRSLVRIAQQKSETWLNELIWREFYQMILWHFPQVEAGSFKASYDKIIWRNNEAEFQSWCEGRTGYPIVDAGMRELNATGFMHNRVRMITASFLTKHLLIDWRWGEAYFGQKLLDYDLAANNGGWQWAAGSGCDAAPYFRVFNPLLQAKKFDPDRKYIRQWIPEIDTPGYPKPVVDHDTARKRAIQTYRNALNQR